MNLVIMMGRLTKDPTVSYGGANNTCIARFSLAVDRRFKKNETDFFECTSFGKTAEAVEKYLIKGTKIVISGEVQNNNYTNKDGQKVYGTRIMVNSWEFAESKKPANSEDEFMDVPDEDIPFV